MPLLIITEHPALVADLAKSATNAGCSVIISSGKRDSPLSQLIKGQNHSLFLAKTDPLTSRKNWISSMKVKGKIKIDSGAIVALNMGKSLLSAGVMEVLGTFSRGDPIEIIDENHNSFAKGLVNYDNSEINLILGKRSFEAAEILGYVGRTSVIHRDNMVMQ